MRPGVPPWGRSSGCLQGSMHGPTATLQQLAHVPGVRAAGAHAAQRLTGFEARGSGRQIVAANAFGKTLRRWLVQPKAARREDDFGTSNPVQLRRPLRQLSLNTGT